CPLSLSRPPAVPSTSTLSLHDALPIYLARFGADIALETCCFHGTSTVLGRHVAELLQHPLGERRHREVGGRHGADRPRPGPHERSEEHTSELQSRSDLVCRLLLEKKK